METNHISRDEQREHIRQKIQNSNLEGRQLITFPASPAKSLVDETVEKRQRHFSEETE